MTGMGSDHVHEDLRPAVASGDRAELLAARRRAGAGPDVGREHFTVDGTLIEAWASQNV